MVSVIAFYKTKRFGLYRFKKESKEFEMYVKEITNKPIETEDDIVILVATTGGTSRFLAKTAENLEKFIYVGIPYDNSFPSALSAKEIVDGPVVFLRTFREIRNLIEMTEKGKGFDALVIGERVKRKHEKVKYNKISFEELEEKLKRISVDEKIKEIFLKKFKVKNEFLMKLSSFLKDKYSAIDCFNFIEYFGVTPCLAVAVNKCACESDLDSLYRLIVGNGFWMANLIEWDKDYEVIAHCTVNCGLHCCKKIKVVPHFETGKNYSLKCEFEEMDVTVWEEEVYEGKLKSTSGYHACRTQAIIERFREKEPKKNHRVLIEGRKKMMIDAVLSVV